MSPDTTTEVYYSKRHACMYNEHRLHNVIYLLQSAMACSMRILLVAIRYRELVKFKEPAKEAVVVYPQEMIEKEHQLLNKFDRQQVA